MRWCLKCLLFLTLCSPLVARAQDSVMQPGAPPDASQEPDAKAKKEKDEKIEEDRFRFLPIPIFITEPAIGEGLGVALTLFHPVKEGKADKTRLATPDLIEDLSNAREAPPVVTAVAGAYTNNDTWMAGVGHFNNWRNDSIRYSGALATARINSRIFVGNLPLNFSMEPDIFYQELKFRLAESDFMLGAAFMYLNAENEFRFGEQEVPQSLRIQSDFKDVGIAAKAAYETRDNMMNPRSGQILELSLWRYDGAIGSDFDYWSGKLKALSFHTLSEKWTLGLRLEFDAVDGGAPFFAIPWVKLRGIPALRYQNKSAGAVEVEARYLLKPRWEVNAFAGWGWTSDDIKVFENPDSIYNFGVGGRYNVFEAHNVWVGLDIARGPEDWNWYIQVGHPW